MTVSKEIGTTVSSKCLVTQAKQSSMYPELDGSVTKREERKKSHQGKELLNGTQFHNWEHTD